MIARAKLAWAMFRGRSVMYGVKMEFDGHVRLKGDHPMTVANCTFSGRIGPSGPGDLDLYGADAQWRKDLFAQWETNHAEHCTNETPHPPARCLWLPPASLGGWKPAELRNAR